MSYQDVMDMPMAEREWWCNQLSRQKKAEARAAKKG